jgi:3-oxoacyl-[acyl-carrier protein] reductase
MSAHALAGRVALVTGANHGIGAATAVALARLGAHVGLTYLRLENDPDPGTPPEYERQRRATADAVLTDIEAVGGRASAIEADLAEADAPRRVFDAVEAALGPVSILVNNASGWRLDTFVAEPPNRFGWASRLVDATTFDAQFLVDARASALLIAELARRSRERGDGWGRIVSLTSGGSTGFPGEVSYGAAKAALDNYTMSAATELAALGITANVVYPPVTDTGWITDDLRERIATTPGVFGIAAPGEVAEVIAWLCTPAADRVTGNSLRLR